MYEFIFLPQTKHSCFQMCTEIQAIVFFLWINFVCILHLNTYTAANIYSNLKVKNSFKSPTQPAKKSLGFIILLSGAE